MQLQPGKRKALTFTGARNCYDVRKTDGKQYATVLATLSADGTLWPPFIVYPYKKSKDWMGGEQSYPYALSDSGWMTSKAFLTYLDIQFRVILEDPAIEKPVLLLLDGHSSHVNFEVSQFCEENEIILCCFPPHTTHILQPADVSLFKPLKDQWRKTVEGWTSDPVNDSVTLKNIADVLAQTWPLIDRALVKTAFRTTGIFPWDMSMFK